MMASELVRGRMKEIETLVRKGSSGSFYEEGKGLVESLVKDVEVREIPVRLVGAREGDVGEYHANWCHQIWYHLGELVRVIERRKERAEAQGGDSWANVDPPEAEVELTNHLKELAKLRALTEATPKLVEGVPREVLFEDGMLEKEDAWEYPRELTLERDAEMGVCWKGQDPGGDWFWLKKELPDAPVLINFELYPVSTIRGGLITAFCVRPLDPATPLSVASSPRMSDYYKNFDAYHFSVTRGATGYCNLRRCGPGLIMLASFSDPCREYGRWYAVEIVKSGPQVELRVDGKLAVCYVDLGVILPVLKGGYFGLRHFQGFEGWCRNVKIVSLEG